MKKILTTIVAVLIFSMCCLNSVFSVPLNLGIPAMRSGLTKLEQWMPIANYLEKKCGFEIECVIVKNHENLLQGMLDKYYDAGFLNALWEKRSIESGDLRTAARAEAGGKDYFTTSIIVNKNSVMRDLSDLGGEYLAVTVPYESLGGFYIPLILLFQGGLNPENVFTEIIHSETYESILKGVAFGVVDAGAVTSSVLELKEMEQYSRDIRIVAESGRIPQWAMVVQNSVKQDKIESFISELTSMHTDEEGQSLLKKAGFSSFSRIRSADQKISPFFCSEKNGESLISNEYMGMIKQIDANKE
ncbi:MAG: phosphate/phosphite/phosphonate ABC transporter substrate-binding protein [Spirochaetia bacterium]|nr:phosphate/phosphite/phosphonate ABC transporter substrate-binding protein [Spirochaetia bacterium]